jgi:hypothetical protein
MLRVPARLLTPRFAVFHLGEKSLHGASFTSGKDSGVTLMRFRSPIDAFIETYHQRADLLVWTKAEVYQRRIKGCGISQL